MLSAIGWLNSLTGSSVVLCGSAFGIYFCYKSKKSNAKLLFMTGFLVILMSQLYLGQFVDFLSILFIGRIWNRFNCMEFYAICG